MAGFTVGLALARLGPIFVKYLQNLSARTMASVIVLPSDLGQNWIVLTFVLTADQSRSYLIVLVTGLTILSISRDLDLFI